MYKIMIVLMLLAFAGLFFLEGPSGRPILTLQDFKLDVTVLESVSELSDNDTISGRHSTRVVYKWQDENGVWQFSNHVEDKEGAETIELDGIINTMAPVIVDVKTLAVTARHSPSSLRPSLTTIPLSQAMDTIDQARKLQDIIDARKSDIDRAIKTD